MTEVRDQTKPGGTPKVAVVVLNWNGKALTLDCIRSLLDIPTPNVETIVVDNASSDGSVEAVRGEFGDRVVLTVNDHNLGFAAGNNAGIRTALDRGADLVLLLNNDTVVDAGLIDSLLRPFEGAPEVGIAGPKIYYYTPPDQIWFAGGELFLARGLSRHIGIREADRGQFDQQRDVDYVTGCALMARREVFETVGFLDPTYVAYYEDADFCVRARNAGFRVVYVPEGKVWHKISASTGGQVSRRKVTRKLKSTWKFFGRYARPWHWLTIPFFFAADVIRIVTLVLTGRIRNSERT
ncbi:MAG: glycosyltransferase family 2 protein [Candidatus Latescibacterota bacterium]|jgi:GT2 family glycosyltransferase